jgi:PAS domain S-box-containing protein
VRYRRLFESAKDGILILDAQSARIQDVNPFLCELLGYTHEQMVGRRLWEIGTFRDVPSSKCNFRELQREEYIRYEDLPLATADGRNIAVEFVSNVYRADGEDVIQCNIRDISQRKRHDEEHARLLQAVQQTAEAIVMTDRGGAIVFVNPAFERISGWSSDEILGANPRLLKSGRQDDLFYRQMWETLARGEVWSGRIVNRRKDGTSFEEEATISPVRDATGEIVNYVAVGRDVSNEVRLEQRLAQAEKLQAVGRLAGGVAHDFNNLLTVIAGYGEMVHQQLGTEGPLRYEVEQILNAAERAAVLTRQLLAFGRKQVLQPRILDLNTVVAGMESMLRRLLGDDVELVTRLEPGLATVEVDAGQIEQVLMNLVLNARDALADGGRISIATREGVLDERDAAAHSPARPGAYIVLEVADSGAGMDAATLAQIFEPFFTTKEVGKGTGLGLATVYGIVDQSGGFVSAASELGAGTTIEVHLPRVDAEILAVKPEPMKVPMRGTETVLLVEDADAVREMLGRALADGGFNVLVARDGSEALRLATAHDGSIEILMTDVVMPGLSGPRTAELVTRARPGTKVLFISGHSDESFIRQGTMAPGQSFLSKPFRLEALLRRVRELLDADEARAADGPPPDGPASGGPETKGGNT